MVLNGVGSAGKGSIAKALQTMTATPFLHVEMDAFIAMLPDHYWGHPDGFALEVLEKGGKPAVVIKTGAVGERLMRGMRHAVAAMAAQGNDLIIDEVLLEVQQRREYAELLAPFAVFYVGVFAPLDVLEARERQRGDRMIGLARWQYDRVHKDMAYDLEVDTSTATAAECATLIRQKFGL